MVGAVALIKYGVNAVLIEELICDVVEYDQNAAVVAYKDKLGGLDIVAWLSAVIFEPIPKIVVDAVKLSCFVFKFVIVP